MEVCQCPLGLLPHFYRRTPSRWCSCRMAWCQCPLGLLPHFYINLVVLFAVITTIVSMPSRAVTSFLLSAVLRISGIRILSVNALSGCYLISTLRIPSSISFLASCQCPLGLLPHFYLQPHLFFRGQWIIVSMPSRAVTSFLRTSSSWIDYLQGWRCQCPLGLLPHFYLEKPRCNRLGEWSVNALSGCYLISTVPLQKPRFYAVSRDCFCRYLSEYSDSNSFSCMLTIWTYLMR